MKKYDAVFANASFADMARAIAQWAEQEPDHFPSAAYWEEIDLAVLKENTRDGLLFVLTGNHPLALGDNLGIEIYAVTDAAGDTHCARRVVGIPCEDVLAYAGAAAGYMPCDYDARTLAHIDEECLAESVRERVAILTHEWAAHV